jgi:ribosomal protein L11 methyltransferase
MKYYEVKFCIKPLSSDACDLLAALAGEAGFETFEETSEGLTGYVQQPLFDQQLLDSMIQPFPMPDVNISYSICEAEDRDWNEQWEQEGFEPIIISSGENDCALVVHDGRHLPSVKAGIEIEIDARLAFGTGTHETTRMVCATLMDLFASSTPADKLQKPRVLDCGTGTGILAICALKLGAGECVAYDIDEWSVDNARHNAVINGVELTPLLGDSTILNEIDGQFDIVMANINRNILLADMPLFRQKMAPGARLVLSGFYTADIPLLTAEAAKLGLNLTALREAHDWACIVLE